MKNLGIIKNMLYVYLLYVCMCSMCTFCMCTFKVHISTSILHCTFVLYLRIYIYVRVCTRVQVLYVCVFINLYTHHTFVCFGCFLVNIYFFLFASLRFNLFNTLIVEHSLSMAEKLKWQYSSYFKPCIINIGWCPHIA